MRPRLRAEYRPADENRLRTVELLRFRRDERHARFPQGLILVNGEAAAVVPALDRGLAYGDGVFRTLTARQGIPRHWRRHAEKLVYDCGRIRIGAPDLAMLEQEVRAVATRQRDCVVKVIVTRGVSERGYRPDPQAPPTRIVSSAPLPTYPSSHENQGVRIRTCDLRLAEQPALAGIKHLNRLENVLARAEWDDRDIAEGLLYASNGLLVGGTMSNVFIVKDGRLATPDLTRCGVSGVTRDRVIDGGCQHDIACEVRAITMQDVKDADEVFVVNSVITLWPVCEIDGVPVHVGPLTRQVQNRLAQESDEAPA